jgi:Sec-independent protein secretion pathway component TatC
MIEAVPLVILYESSIWLSVLFERRAARMEAASLSEP